MKEGVAQKSQKIEIKGGSQEVAALPIIFNGDQSLTILNTILYSQLLTLSHWHFRPVDFQHTLELNITTSIVFML